MWHLESKKDVANPIGTAKQEFTASNFTFSFHLIHHFLSSTFVSGLVHHGLNFALAVWTVKPLRLPDLTVRDANTCSYECSWAVQHQKHSGLIWRIHGNRWKTLLLGWVTNIVAFAQVFATPEFYDNAVVAVVLLPPGAQNNAGR